MLNNLLIGYNYEYKLKNRLFILGGEQMKFYQEFSQYYDAIFQLQEEKVEFLADKVSEDSKILDVATGTGNYALALAEEGYKVEGIDLSAEMIELAREKARAKNVNSKFKIGNMKNLSSIYSQEEFDFIYCLGNSLVHLNGLSEIKQVLQQIHDLLTDDGRLVIQIVNYSRILANQITSLPTISNHQEEVKLIRNYELQGDKVEFEIKLYTPQGQFKNSILLYPLTARELRQVLTETGFGEIKFYGGFNYQSYLPEESFPLVVEASK